MGWLDDLYGKVVGLDTAPFIYYIEQHPGYVSTLNPFFQAVAHGEIIIVTSVITLLETLVLPLRKGDTNLAKSYRDILFHTKGLATVMLSQEITEEAAQLRASHNFRVPDAIQIATAIKSSASFFVTNDKQLQKKLAVQVLMLEMLK